MLDIPRTLAFLRGIIRQELLRPAERLEDAELRLGNAAVSLANAKATFAGVEQLTSLIEPKVDARHAFVEELDDAVASLDEDLVALGDDIDGLQEDVDTLAEDIDERTDKLDTVNAEVLELKTDLLPVVDQIEAFKLDFELARDGLALIGAAVAGGRVTISAIQLDIDGINTALSEREVENCCDVTLADLDLANAAIDLISGAIGAGPGPCNIDIEDTLFINPYPAPGLRSPGDARVSDNGLLVSTFGDVPLVISATSGGVIEINTTEGTFPTRVYFAGGQEYVGVDGELLARPAGSLDSVPFEVIRTINASVEWTEVLEYRGYVLAFVGNGATGRDARWLNGPGALFFDNSVTGFYRAAAAGDDALFVATPPVNIGGAFTLFRYTADFVLDVDDDLEATERELIGGLGAFPLRLIALSPEILFIETASGIHRIFTKVGPIWEETTINTALGVRFHPVPGGVRGSIDSFDINEPDTEFISPTGVVTQSRGLLRSAGLFDQAADTKIVNNYNFMVVRNDTEALFGGAVLPLVGGAGSSPLGRQFELVSPDCPDATERYPVLLSTDLELSDVAEQEFIPGGTVRSERFGITSHPRLVFGVFSREGVPQLEALQGRDCDGNVVAFREGFEDCAVACPGVVDATANIAPINPDLVALLDDELLPWRSSDHRYFGSGAFVWDTERNHESELPFPGSDMWHLAGHYYMRGPDGIYRLQYVPGLGTAEWVATLVCDTSVYPDASPRIILADGGYLMATGETQPGHGWLFSATLEPTSSWEDVDLRFTRDVEFFEDDFAFGSPINSMTLQAVVNDLSIFTFYVGGVGFPSVFLFDTPAVLHAPGQFAFFGPQLTELRDAPRYFNPAQANPVIERHDLFVQDNPLTSDPTLLFYGRSDLSTGVGLWRLTVSLDDREYFSAEDLGLDVDFLNLRFGLFRLDESRTNEEPPPLVLERDVVNDTITVDSVVGQPFTAPGARKERLVIRSSGVPDLETTGARYMGPRHLVTYQNDELEYAIFAGRSGFSGPRVLAAFRAGDALFGGAAVPRLAVDEVAVGEGLAVAIENADCSTDIPDYAYLVLFDYGDPAVPRLVADIPGPDLHETSGFALPSGVSVARVELFRSEEEELFATALPEAVCALDCDGAPFEPDAPEEPPILV